VSRSSTGRPHGVQRASASRRRLPAVPPIDLAAAFPADRQALSTFAQLRAEGVSRRSLTKAVERDEVRRVRPGVYAPMLLEPAGRHLLSGGMPDHRYVAQARAALLSLGRGAVASGRTAAVLWGFDLYVEPAGIEVLVPAERGRANLTGVSVTRSRNHEAVEHAVLGLAPIPILTAADTVVRCALERPLREAVVIADSALRSRHVTVEELEKRVIARDGTHGSKELGRLLGLIDPASGSVLESLFRFLMAEHGLFPSSQVVLTGRPGRIGRVDFVFPRERLVVECDGRRWHDPEDARRKDRWRDNELTRSGWRVLRVTWSEVVHSSACVVALVRDTLALAAA